MGKYKKIWKNWWFLGIVLLLLLIAYFMLSGPIKKLNQTKLEYKLIQAGKTTSAREITDEFVEKLKTKNYEEMKNYLASDCVFYKDSQVYSIETCFKDLEEYNSHAIEKRGNDLKDSDTYRIYWNGTKYENTNQIIELFMKKVITKDKVTYEIYRIKFTDNTLANTR